MARCSRRRARRRRPLRPAEGASISTASGSRRTARSRCSTASPRPRRRRAHSWVQGPDKEGPITGGTYDPDKGTLEIEYYEPWTDIAGTASFEVSEDGNTLDGTYEQKNSRGDWVLTR